MAGNFVYLIVILAVSTTKGFALNWINDVAKLNAFRVLKVGAITSVPILSTINNQAALAATVEVAKPLPLLTKEDVVDKKTAALFVQQLQQTRELLTDELDAVFDTENLGIVLTETSYKGFPVVTLKSIIDEKVKAANPTLREGAVLIRVGETITDGTSLKSIASLVKASPRPLTMRFRDPSRFFEQLDSCNGKPLRVVSTSYLPANARDAGATEQIIIVERLAMPPPEERKRSSQMLDVMEIQYVMSVKGNDDGVIVDSSAERAPPGTSSKSIYYVLGQRNGPPGKYPPGFDLVLRGMVVGERRRITLPYTVAFERAGVPDHNIPGFATVIVTVKLLSLT